MTNRLYERGFFDPSRQSRAVLERIADEADADFHLRALGAQINVLDVLRYQAGIGRDSIDVGPAVEYSQEIARRSGRPANGIYMPHAALSTRGLSVGTATAGGNTVATNLLSNSFIDMLRPRAKVLQAGAMTLEGLTGNVAIPRQTAASTAYWINEDEHIPASQGAFDQVQMTPRTAAAFTNISRKLLLQSSIQVQDFVSSDLMATIGLAIDAACINGLGSAQPTGILQTTGVQTQTIAGAKPTWAELVSMYTKCAADSGEGVAFMVTSKTRADLQQVEKSSGSGVFVWDAPKEAGTDGSIGGTRAFVSNNLPQTLGAGTNQHALIAGVWSDLIIGLWGAVDLLVDPYSNATSGSLRITAFQDLDVCIRHPERFVKAQYAPA